MSNKLDLTQLVAGGQKLVRVDDTDYVAVHVVFALPAEGAPALYCLERDWARSHAARIASLEHAAAELAMLAETNASEVVRLSRRVHELERQLAAQPKTAPADASPESLACPDCGRNGWKSPKAVQMHQQRAHQGMQNTPRPPAPIVPVEVPWRCADCDSTEAGPFARSLKDPARCIRCAQLVHGQKVAA